MVVVVVVVVFVVVVVVVHFRCRSLMFCSFFLTFISVTAVVFVIAHRRRHCFYILMISKTMRLNY